MKKNFFWFLILASFISSYGQEIILQGKLTDTLQFPLENANMLALPNGNNTSIAFSITDANGFYKLTLKKDTPYTLEISYLGYQKKNVQINLDENTTENFTLVQSNESLEEIILKQKLAVSVKKDTITYQIDVFTTGEERKLREVLKKLPGVEVDRDGQVTVNGKRVNKLLVEGKPFFTGGTALGINNIPADAVEEIEVLDHYTEIAFLKGLSDSNILAMNIKLKEGKKKFLFGDVEVGSGIKDRYLLHPNLYYYSPKTNINFIGDLNNTGGKSFTFIDYVEFEGGVAKLIENPKSYSNLMNSEFVQYLANDDFVYNRNAFGAFNVSQQLTPKITATAFRIFNASKIVAKRDETNTYLLDNTVSDIENRTTSTTAKNLFTLSKFSANYKPGNDEDLTYETVVKTSSGNAQEQYQSLTFTETDFVDSSLVPNSLDVIQNFAYNKQFSYKHTSTLQGDLRISDNENNTDWQFSQPIFSQVIPLEGEGPFNINQQINTKIYNGSLALKHYWVLNNSNHIYPIVGHDFSKQEYSSVDKQLLENGTNEFGSAGFNNNTKFQLNDTYFGFQYKFKIADIIIKPGLIYHNYFWKVSQFSETQNTTIKPQLLPELQIKWDIKTSEIVSLKYNLESRFSDVSFFANRFRLAGFNSLYRGKAGIENELAHTASLYYYKFSLLRGIFMNAGINYSKRVNTVRNTTIIEGIDQINTAVYSDLPENSVAMNASFSKKIGNLKYTLLGRVNFYDYSRNVNNALIEYRSNNYSYTFKTETSFKNYPNLEIGLRQSFNDFSSENIENRFIQTDPYANLQYDFLKGFILNANYTYSHYKNEANNISNTFQIGNSSLYYNKEDSSWGFEFEVNNLFDVKFKNENAFNQYIINDKQIFIQPRTVLFKLSYKF